MLSQVVMQVIAGGEDGSWVGSGADCTEASEGFSSVMASLADGRPPKSSGGLSDGEWKILFPGGRSEGEPELLNDSTDRHPSAARSMEPPVFLGSPLQFVLSETATEAGWNTISGLPLEGESAVPTGDVLDVPLQVIESGTARGEGWNPIPGLHLERESSGEPGAVPAASTGSGAIPGKNAAADILQVMTPAREGIALIDIAGKREAEPVSAKQTDLPEMQSKAGAGRVTPPGTVNISESSSKPVDGGTGVNPPRVEGSGQSAFDAAGGDAEGEGPGSDGRNHTFRPGPQAAEGRTAVNPEPAGSGAFSATGKAETFEHHLQYGQGSRDTGGGAKEAGGADAGKPAGAASAANPPPEEDVKARQTARLVTGAVLKARGASRTMEIQMKPEVLGRLRIELVINGKQAEVKMITEVFAAKEAIEQSLAQIRADLQRQGLDLQRCEVQLAGSFGSGGDAGGRAKGRASAGRHIEAGRRNDEKDSVIVPGEVNRDDGAGVGRVDFFA